MTMYKKVFKMSLIQAFMCCTLVCFSASKPEIIINLNDGEKDITVELKSAVPDNITDPKEFVLGNFKITVKKKDGVSFTDSDKIMLTVETRNDNCTNPLGGLVANTNTIEFTCNTNFTEKVTLKIFSKGSFKNFTFNGRPNNESLELGTFDDTAPIEEETSFTYLLDNFKRYIDKPYVVNLNKVYLHFDDEGNMVNKKPVNIDDNDEFIIRIAAKKSEIPNYKIQIDEGDYDPSDLNFRPSVDISVGKKEDAAPNSEKVDPYDHKEFYAGPFTSDFAFTIINKKTGKKLASYRFRINKTYHVGVGVSLINSNLSDPTYTTKYISDSTNKIISTSGGQRMLASFNVIWYWSALLQNRKSNNITQGRDVLKEESWLSLKRVYPTAGVSLNDKFSENLFLGLMYEFARGGNVTAGVHYGKVKRLADGFEDGMTLRKSEEIVLKDVYLWDWYFGINIDNRIFNALFK